MKATRPALRASVLVFEGDDDDLHFLLTSSSVRKTFTVDPIARRMVELLDGTLTIPELEAQLRDAPGYIDGYVNDVLDVLHAEDLLASPSSGSDVALLSAGERERYGRQLGLLEELAREAGISASGPSLQAALRASTVVVIGTGGLWRSASNAGGLHRSRAWDPRKPASFG